MGFLKGVLKVASNLGKSVAYEPPVESVQRIMVIKEPPRSRKQQLHDLINDNRDTDKMRKTKRRLNEVNSGRAINSDCSCFSLPECFRHTQHQNRRGTRRDFRR